MVAIFVGVFIGNLVGQALWVFLIRPYGEKKGWF